MTDESHFDSPTTTGGGVSPPPPPGAWRTVAPTPHDARTIAAWVSSAAEAEMWASRAEHPFPAHVLSEWWNAQDVMARLLLDPEGTPVAYGEVWEDEEEDEVELARLIVAPARRREGVGRRLVDELSAIAKAGGRSACFLRVVPANVDARALYRAAGFVEVGPATAAEWNAGQPVAYVWMQHPGFR